MVKVISESESVSHSRRAPRFDEIMNFLLRWLATAAGWATILCVILIPVYLFISAWPLFLKGTDGSVWEEIVPLIFGTLKATVYALLFGAPLAILAAIHTSEMMRPRARAIVKPMIELLAAIPSVLYAVLAGVLLAPFLKERLSSVIAVLFLVPFTLLLIAHLIPLLPKRISSRLERRRVLLLLMVVPISVSSGMMGGPLLESVFFAGDLKGWLQSGEGTGIGGWMLMWIPLMSLLTIWLMENFIAPRFLRRGPRMAFVRFCVGTLITLALSWCVANLCDLVTLDTRDFILGPYHHHNAFLVGLVLGIAIVPLIYTLAEDALSSVPGRLRIGSLATGATHWQTAFRIIVPTAMSGLITAILMGMTRAVGETLIVTLASGDRPLIDGNVFAGFRALTSELLQFARTGAGSERAPILYLTALILFLFTFVLSTMAELLRTHFRKKARRL